MDGKALVVRHQVLLSDCSHSFSLCSLLLSFNPPSPPQVKLTALCLSSPCSLPAVTKATSCILERRSTFAQRAVWCAKVHQAGYFCWVAHVCHHCLLPVTHGWICRRKRRSQILLKWINQIKRAVWILFWREHTHTEQSRHQSTKVRSWVQGGLQSGLPNTCEHFKETQIPPPI